MSKRKIIVGDPVVPCYVYRATPLGVVDGDTVDIRVDLGFKMNVDMRVRLYGINTPELGQAGYSEAKAFVAHWIGLVDARTFQNPPALVVKTAKPKDKYGRWLAELFREGESESLSEAIIANSLGVAYFGGAK